MALKGRDKLVLFATILILKVAIVCSIQCKHLLEYDVWIKDGLLHTSDADYSIPGGMGQFIYNACEKYADNTFQICTYTNSSITFSTFKTRCQNLAANLRHICDVKQGDIVMTSMKNSLENAVPVGATLFLNAVTCSLHPSLSVRECEYLINLTKPKIIVLDADVVPNIKQAIENNKFEPILVVNYESFQTGRIGNLCLQDLMKSTDITADFQPVFVEDPTNSISTILFSSGSTGMPKGICLNHKSVLFCGKIIGDTWNGSQLMICLTTFYWVSGLGLFIGQFLTGGTKITLRNFNIHEFCDICLKYKVGGAFLATPYLSKLLAVKEKINQTSLKAIFSGGVMSTKGLFSTMQATFPQIHFTQAYGMTETAGPFTSFLANYKNFSKKFPESIGIPVAGFTVKIINPETGMILGPNQQGEICCKSEFNMMGYYKNNVESPFDSEGYIRTGDLGYFDENKMMYISGRKKEMFKYQSWRIVPAILESVIKAHPAVDEVVVFGIPHAEDGFLPSAAITLQENECVKPEEIIDFVAERVADRERLRGGVYILTNLPRTPSGKVQRNKVQEHVLKTC